MKVRAFSFCWLLFEICAKVGIHLGKEDLSVLKIWRQFFFLCVPVL